MTSRHSKDTRQSAFFWASAVAAVVSAVMLGSAILGVIDGGRTGGSTSYAADPGTPAEGTVVIGPASGPLGNVSLAPDPAPAFCPGDSTAGYLWHGFLADVANDPATLTYEANGPVATGGSGAVLPLLSTTGALVVSETTGPDDGSGGQIVGIPGFSLDGYGAALPDGEYNIGLACSLARETVRFWSARINVSAGEYEIVDSPPPPPPSSSDPDPTDPAPTDPAPTSSTPSASTIPPTSGTTANTQAGTPPFATAPSTPSGQPVAAPGGTLAETGTSSWTIVLWGALLLVFGRICFLLARKPRVIPTDSA